MPATSVENAVVTNESPEKLAQKYTDFFDKIIVDAPCSGEGMFKKEPQAITEWSIEHTISCGQRQKNILASAFKMLKGDGYLVYSTCTFAPCENEEVVCWVLENYPEVEIEVIPGVSALLSGAALLGAPIGNAPTPSSCLPVSTGLPTTST